MFRGKFEHTIDDKGRISVPSRFREILQATNDDRVVITNFIMSSTRCLDVYPQAAWVRLEEKLREKPQFDQGVMRFQNFYVANAHECVLDKQGRILLPPTLREYAGLKKDAVFTSALEKFRIWDKEQWDRVFGEAEQSFIERPDELSRLGI
ncbi:MAG TPA: division/cell wall cluster transcriptional repressor MraZ [Candidatus Margulisiibacteriota bacterium]|nr:division/cell wall cluster transcriptional repressor MraZ [Candidatus Margulisiibacteriota bacterium]